ncbi:PREDICTED: methionine aminopeptidase 1 [Chinchilla lanigera]|uniref:methionine aminopeptidase 1 n=1 Tax=Chinchilla lanigera TaxID=34839 RepID=UPI000695CADA|nr:PREDICTED: methionine aminopeptidase 1 [Chinchilla lanigera]
MDLSLIGDFHFDNMVMRDNTKNIVCTDYPVIVLALPALYILNSAVGVVELVEQKLWQKGKATGRCCQTPVSGHACLGPLRGLRGGRRSVSTPRGVRATPPQSLPAFARAGGRARSQLVPARVGPSRPPSSPQRARPEECFKGSWATHKLLHKKAKDEKAKREVSSWTLEGDINTDPWAGYRYTGKLRPHYPLMPTRPVPSYIQRPDYADHPLGMSESEQALKGTSQIKLLSSEDIEGMRLVCRLAREVLDIAAGMIKPGVTTEEIDHAVHLACIARNCYPSPLNYYNFPKSCCTSVNEVICHGIPDRRPLQEGDIVNVDITLYRNGYHGDLNETFFVGDVDEGARKLVQTTYECLMQAIDAVKPGVRYRELGNIIQKHAQASGFSVVRSYCGHGIHKLFHTAPNVPHYAKNKAVGVMKSGHVFTIEPMICEGGWQDETWPDGWTAVTRDGKRSAQFEHTLLVTDTGCEILTRRLDSTRPHFMS